MQSQARLSYAGHGRFIQIIQESVRNFIVIDMTDIQVLEAREKFCAKRRIVLLTQYGKDSVKSGLTKERVWPGLRDMYQ